MKMEDCSKFNYCRAPICPLDRNLEKRVYLKGEPVCPRWDNYKFRKRLSEEQFEKYIRKMS